MKNLVLDFENLVKSARVKKAIFGRYFLRSLKILEREKKMPKGALKRGVRVAGKGLRGAKKNAGQQGSIHLVIVDNPTIQKLNKSHRGLNKPTDVLSFSYLEEWNFPQQDLLGEIAISLPVAKKQAREHRKNLTQELQFLFVHGLLHIFGYDHEEARERKEMFKLQDEILGTKMWREIID